MSMLKGSNACERSFGERARLELELCHDRLFVILFGRQFIILQEHSRCGLGMCTRAASARGGTLHTTCACCSDKPGGLGRLRSEEESTRSTAHLWRDMFAAAHVRPKLIPRRNERAAEVAARDSAARAYVPLHRFTFLPVCAVCATPRPTCFRVLRGSPERIWVSPSTY